MTDALNPGGAIVVPEGAAGTRSEHDQQLTVHCGCGTPLALLVCAEQPITADLCDYLVAVHLRQRGWTTDPLDDDIDVCPECTRSAAA